MTEPLKIFSGNVRRPVDEKGRIVVPADWREGVEQFRVMKHPQLPAVELILESEFLEILSRLDALTSQPVEDRAAFRRYFFANAAPCPVDKQGRLMLPSDLVKALGLQGEIILAGTGRRIEVWKPGEWEIKKAADADAYSRVSAALGLS